MKWFKRKVPYVPQGRVGYYHKSTAAWVYTIVMEEIGSIGDRSQIKILDVQVGRGYGDSEKSCLDDFSRTDFVLTHQMIWETEEQRTIRLGNQESFMVRRSVRNVRKPDLRPHEQRFPPKVFDADD